MAIKLSAKKPLVGNKRSHALNATKKVQKANKQTKKVNGVKVQLAASEWRTLNKNN